MLLEQSCTLRVRHGHRRSRAYACGAGHSLRDWPQPAPRRTAASCTPNYVIFCFNSDFLVAGPKVVNDDLKFLTKEMGIFEGRKERSDCLEKLYKALLNISPTSVSCERVFSIAGGLIPPRRSLLSDERFDELVFLKGYFKNFGGVDDF